MLYSRKKKCHIYTDTQNDLIVKAVPHVLWVSSVQNTSIAIKFSGWYWGFFPHYVWKDNIQSSSLFPPVTLCSSPEDVIQSWISIKSLSLLQPPLCSYWLSNMSLRTKWETMYAIMHLQYSFSYRPISWLSERTAQRILNKISFKNIQK